MKLKEWAETRDPDKEVTATNVTLFRASLREDEVNPYLLLEDVEWIQPFGDDQQYLGHNDEERVFVAISELAKSVHIWQYPDEESYEQAKAEVAEFFGETMSPTPLSEE